MGIERIAVGGFCCLTNLSCLMLVGNKLVSPPPLCPLKCRIVKLLLGMNNIRKFSKYFLIGFRRLERLHLDQNGMVQMPDLHWVRHTLQHIGVYRNNISSLDAFYSNAPFKSLLYIDMGFNNIRTFNVTLLRQMTRQPNFIIHCNQLTYVDDFRVYHIESIDLWNNPWHCDAKLSWMGDEDFVFEKRLTCATPPCLNGMAIADMSK